MNTSNTVRANKINGYYSEIFAAPILRSNSLNNSDVSSNLKYNCIIQQWFHPLNKSVNKYICVGLSVDDLSPCIKISGNKGVSILLNESEWRELLEYQGVIINNLYLSDSRWEPLEFASIKLYFETVKGENVLKIVKNGFYIYLGRETVNNLWQLTPLLEKRLTLLKNQEFKQYFSILKNNYANAEGSIVNKIFEVLSIQENASENACAIMELAISHPTILECKIKEY